MAFGQMREADAPLLSICIPNYNRVDWLAVSLRALAPQVCALGGAVELCIADNCSKEDAPGVIAAARAFAPIKFHRHEANLGPFPNCLYLVEKMATGKYIWLLGNDDIVRAGAVARIVAALRAHPEASVFYANYLTWKPDAPGGILHDPDRIPPTSPRGSIQEADRALAHAHELLAYDANCLTPACCLIMSREDTVAAYRGSIKAKSWDTLESTLPPPTYLAGHLLQKPAWYIAEPCSVVNAESTWPEHLPYFALELIPDLIDRFESGGAEQKTIDAVRRHWIKSAAFFFVDYCALLALPEPLPDNARVSILRYLWRFRRYPELWRAMAQLPLLLAANALPKDTRQSLRRGLTLVRRALPAP